MALPFWEPVGGQSEWVNPKIDNDWDHATIMGVPIPGVVEVFGVPERGFDHKKKPGNDGGNTTLSGRKPAKFEFRIHIWTPDQWTKMQDVMAKIWPSGGDTGMVDPGSLAFDVYHPALAFVGISRGILIAPAPPMPGPAKGERIVTLRFEEWRPVTPVKKSGTKTPKASKQSVPVDPAFTKTGAADVSAQPQLGPSDTFNQAFFNAANDSTNTPSPPSTDQNFLGPNSFLNK